jgi:ceramide glucosyltransferase
VVVETHLGKPGWGAVWRHQVRWARTIRVSRRDGYVGLPVTHAGLWAALCLVTAAVTAVTAPALTTYVGPHGAISVGDAGAAAAARAVAYAVLFSVAIVVARIGAVVASAIALRDARTLALAWLAPLWDLFAFAVWVAGWSGSAIHWRGTRMTLTPDGRLIPASRPPAAQAVSTRP